MLYWGVHLPLYTIQWTKKIWLYGKKQLVRYYSVDLLWGQGLYRKLRFVLAEYDGKRVIFISTNLSLHPSSIIRFYGYRFRIEGAFRTFKLDLGGMAYHFWTKAAPRLNHFRKKDAPDALSAVTSAGTRTDFENCPRHGDVRPVMLHFYGNPANAFR